MRLGSDYNRVLAKDMQSKKDIYQEVEQHRRDFPNYKESTLNYILYILYILCELLVAF